MFDFLQVLLHEAACSGNPLLFGLGETCRGTFTCLSLVSKDLSSYSVPVTILSSQDTKLACEGIVCCMRDRRVGSSCAVLHLLSFAVVEVSKRKWAHFVQTSQRVRRGDAAGGGRAAQALSTTCELLLGDWVICEQVAVVSYQTLCTVHTALGAL